jgi:recombination protein RecA
MDFKLHPSERGRFEWQPELEESVAPLAARAFLRAVPARILKRYVKPVTRSTHRFDLEIEGNHTYLVDGVIVHNSPETTTGGRALKFYSSIRLDIRRVASIKEADQVIGSRAKVKVVKNKVAAPFREAEFDILYGEGISKEGDLLDLGVEHKVIEKSGAWYTFDSERMGQGRENARQFLRDNTDIRAEVDARLRKGLGLPVLERVVEAKEKAEVLPMPEKKKA